VPKKAEKDLTPFGYALRDAIRRSASFKNRTAFARAIGMDPPNLYRYENGTTVPRIDQIAEWARVLGCDPAELIPESRFCVAGQSTVLYEDEAAIRSAVSGIELSEAQYKRLLDVRHSIGPLTEGEAKLIAEQIARNGERPAYPKVSEGGQWVAPAAIGDSAMFAER
jgi:transcriptional regulator with XRE-family HTH domain